MSTRLSRESPVQGYATVRSLDEPNYSGHSHPDQVMTGTNHGTMRPQMHQPINLEELLKQKVEAFAIQERLVQSLMRERDELRTQVSSQHAPRITYAETQFTNRIQTIRSDPTDSATPRPTAGWPPAAPSPA